MGLFQVEKLGQCVWCVVCRKVILININKFIINVSLDLDDIIKLFYKFSVYSIVLK